MRPHVGHHFQKQMRVVDAQHAQAENFIHVQQVPQIGAREMPAGEAVAAFLDGPEIRLAGAAFDAEAPWRVKAVPLRATRVGSTQSNMSTPRAISSTICAGVPRPIA